MAYGYHHRVCGVGSEGQIRLMLHTMQRNAGIDDEDEDTGYIPTLAELLESLHVIARDQGGLEDGFLYDMICRTPFGSGEAETASLTVREFLPGVWTACFDYRSEDCLQPEDWLALQNRSEGLLFCAQYACDDILREKGRLLLADAKAMDNWDSVDACWFWLTHRYFCGQSPDDLVKLLSRLRKTLAMEDEELTPEVLLEESQDNLRLIAESVADRDAMEERLREARRSGDHAAVIAIWISAAEAELWDVERLPLYLSCLKEASDAWNGRG